MLLKVMVDTFRTVPSGSQLRTFAVAANLESFTEAAKALGVTQAAVSRLVNKTEQQLDVDLFTRSPKGVTLTNQGRKLYEAVSRSLSDIAEAIAEIQRETSKKQTVVISVSSAFVTHWLIPRIGRLMARHPEIDLHFQLQSGEPEGDLRSADLGIRLEGNCDEQLVLNTFEPEVIRPVCAPGYLATFGRPEDATFAQDFTLIQFANPRLSWSEFLTAASYELPPAGREIVFNDYSIVLQAALAGEGIALGWGHIVRHLLERGLLVPAFDAVVVTGKHYQVFRNRNSGRNVALDNLIRWLGDESSKQY